MDIDTADLTLDDPDWFSGCETAAANVGILRMDSDVELDTIN
jgi:hypothetical protein